FFSKYIKNATNPEIISGFIYNLKAPRGAFLLAIKLKISMNYYAPRRAFSINIICALRRA
ncbi:MAG: hypothetical protein ACLR8B_03940, partial [Peptoniphilus harei]